MSDSARSRLFTMLGRLILVSELDRCLLKAHSAIAQVKMGWWDCAFFVAFGERRGRGFELYKKIGKREGSDKQVMLRSSLLVQTTLVFNVLQSSHLPTSITLCSTTHELAPVRRAHRGDLR